MTMNRRQFTTLAALSALLAACNAPSRQTDPNSSAGSSSNTGPTDFDWRRFEGTEITLFLDDHPWTDGVRPYLTDFEALTGIKPSLKIVPEPAYFEEMETAIRGNPSLADVYFLPVDSTAFRQWKNNLVRPLTPFVEDPKLTAPDYDLLDFPEGFRVAGLYPPASPEAELYGIPATFEAYILFYNKDLVARYLDGKVPQTMPELITAAQQINQAGNGEIFGAVMRGIRSDAIIDTVTGVVLNSWGQEPTPLPYNIWFNNDWSKPRLNEQRITEGLTYYAQLMQAGPPNIQSIDWPDANQLFQEGKVAFFIDASLFGPGYENTEVSKIAGKVGYSTLPKTDQGSLTGHWLWGLGIPSGAAQPEAAWYFIQWATSRAMEPKIGIKTGGAPRLSTWLNNVDYANAMNPEYALAVQTAMQTSRPTVVFRDNWSEMAFAIADAIQSIYAGEAPETVTQALQQQIALLAQG